MAVVSLNSIAGKDDVRPRSYGFPGDENFFPCKPTDVTAFFDGTDGAQVNPDDGARNNRYLPVQSGECPLHGHKFDKKFMSQQVVAFNTGNVSLTGTYFRETRF